MEDLAAYKYRVPGLGLESLRGTGFLAKNAGQKLRFLLVPYRVRANWELGEFVGLIQVTCV